MMPHDLPAWYTIYQQCIRGSSDSISATPPKVEVIGDVTEILPTDSTRYSSGVPAIFAAPSKAASPTELPVAEAGIPLARITIASSTPLTRWM